MEQTKVTMDEMVAEVKRYASEHYVEGWDEVVEAWDDEDIISDIGGATTLKGAVANVWKTVKLRNAVAADIKATEF